MNIENEISVNGLRVSEDVIKKIIIFAAEDVDGVAGLSGRKAGDIRGAVAMKLKDEFPSVSVRIDVTPNCNVMNVCEKVQNRIHDDVMSMTGIALAKVNVYVAGISTTR